MPDAGADTQEDEKSGGSLSYAEGEDPPLKSSKAKDSLWQPLRRILLPILKGTNTSTIDSRNAGEKSQWLAGLELVGSQATQ